MGKGKLVFKGDKVKSKKKKKSKYSSKITTTDTVEVSAALARNTSSDIFESQAEELIKLAPQQQSTKPVIRDGKGQITTSGTVIMGHDTKFNSYLNAGDAILVKIPSKDGLSSREEMRVLTIRLSDTSASLSSSFSSDLKLPTNFKYIKRPKNAQKERAEREKKEKLTKAEIERSAFGTYKSGDGNSKELVYRERTEQGGYRIRRETVDSDSTRSDLLYMRTQKKSDKFC